MSYPTRISRFKKWASLKVDSGQVGLGDKKGSSPKVRARRRRRRRHKNAKVQTEE